MDIYFEDPNNIPKYGTTPLTPVAPAMASLTPADPLPKIRISTTMIFYFILVLIFVIVSTSVLTRALIKSEMRDFILMFHRS